MKYLLAFFQSFFCSLLFFIAFGMLSSLLAKGMFGVVFIGSFLLFPISFFLYLRRAKNSWHTFYRGLMSGAILWGLLSLTILVITPAVSKKVTDESNASIAKSKVISPASTDKEVALSSEHLLVGIVGVTFGLLSLVPLVFCLIGMMLVKNKFSSSDSKPVVASVVSA